MAFVFDLGPELMGVIALGFFWIHTLLIAGAAALDLRDLGRLARRLRPIRGPLRAGAAGMLIAEVRSGRGPEARFARQRVEQLGRADRRGGPPAIHFHDVGHHSEVFGGTITPEPDHATELEVVPLTEPRASTWPDPIRQRGAMQPGSREAFEAAHAAASRAKGFARTVESSVGAGDRIWIAGRLVEGPRGLRLEDDDAGLIVAASDPRPWLARKRALVLGFVIVELLLAAVCTVLILWPPLWGWPSMIGAAAALGFFLGVQPIGVSVHDAVRTPDRAFVRGEWRAE